MSNDLRYLLAFGVALLGAAVLTPVVVRVAHRTGRLDHPKDDRFHSTATPYLGGLAIAGGLLLVSVLVTGARAQLTVILLSALAIGTLGLVDDIRSVGPGVKIAVEASLGLALWMVGIRAGLFNIAALDLLLTMAWVVVVVNAVNILDNMDGVAAGVAAVSALGLAAIAASQADYLVTSLALAVAGGCLGFLPYNFARARIFLGDAGTLFLGSLLASLGLKLDLVGPTNLARAVVPALALAVPLFDIILVTIARWSEGRPIYLGGTDHSAHRLHAKGMAPGAIALLAYAAQAACSTLAFVVSRSNDGVAWVSFGLTLLLAAVLLTLLLRIQVVVISDAPVSTSDRLNGPTP
jgi:UDP-GlcNAc:undecaprenyl-phosphate/decaprenyl-phosphate GlcNAc-1-phosphate transferase